MKRKKRFPKKNINHAPRAESARKVFGILVRGIPHIQNSHFPNSHQKEEAHSPKA